MGLRAPRRVFMFERLKAGVINMAKSILNAKRDNCELVRDTTKSVVSGLNYKGNKTLRKMALVGMVTSFGLFAMSYIE